MSLLTISAVVAVLRRTKQTEEVLDDVDVMGMNPEVGWRIALLAWARHQPLKSTLGVLRQGLSAAKCCG